MTNLIEKTVVLRNLRKHKISSVTKYAFVDQRVFVTLQKYQKESREKKTKLNFPQFFA